jgi:hypothetical protein
LGELTIAHALPSQCSTRVTDGAMLEEDEDEPTAQQFEVDTQATL